MHTTLSLCFQFQVSDENQNTVSAQQELSDVTKQFEVLKQNQQNQEVKGQAAGRLKNIMMEAEDMKRQVEDKLQQIQGQTADLLVCLRRDRCDLQMNSEALKCHFCRHWTK